MKKFILKISLYLFPFCCIYGIYCISQNYISGDLGQLGGISFGKTYDKTLSENYLSDNPVKNIPVYDLTRFADKMHPAIFTIGDSFNQMGIVGYQNYLARLLNCEIVTIQNNILFYSLDEPVSLLNSEIIDSSFCKIMIIESVDRYLIGRLEDIDFERLYSMIEKREEQKDRISALSELCSWMRLQLNYDNPVKEYGLKMDCFTHNWSNKLFYYQDDLLFLYTRKASIDKAKENLMLLNKKFSSKGIKLIFLIAADKYDVYRPFAVDDSLPIDHTTEELSKIPDVCIIDTKPIFQSMVQQGIQDVYRINDTHWSYKASEVVAEKIYEHILR
jgi:hypothetical protein